MCLLAALGLFVPRLILILLWFVNAPLVLGPFSDLPLPDFVAPLIGLPFFRHSFFLLFVCLAL